MATIFPGMDPYLEHPLRWPSVHRRAVVYLADEMEERIQPRYAVSLEERVYIEFPPRQFLPDVAVRRTHRREPLAGPAVAEIDEPEIVEVTGLEVHEPYIEILDMESGQRVVTVVELLSPSNKSPGPGRDKYLAKQRQTLQSDASLVEIDLLRAGQHTVAIPEPAVRGDEPFDYLVCTNQRTPTRCLYEFYRRRVRERLPRIGVPLANGDPSLPVDLQAILAKVYQAGHYRNRIDYRKPCVPALAAEDQAWADELIRKAIGNEGLHEPEGEHGPGGD